MQNTKPLFKFELSEPGAAKASFSYGGEMVEFQLTNVCNPLGDLLGGLVSMLTNPTYLWGETTQSPIVWYNDEESVEWNLEMHSDQTISVKITETNGFFDDDKTLLVDAHIDTCDFIFSIVHELDKMIKQIGLLNYHQQWCSNEFPLTYFLFLKKYLIEKGRWPQPKHKRTEILSDEFQLLLG